MKPFMMNVILQKIKYEMHRVASCFNRVIELNQKVLIFDQK